MTDEDHAQVRELLRREWERRLQQEAGKFVGRKTSRALTKAVEAALDAATRDYHGRLVIEIGHA